MLIKAGVDISRLRPEIRKKLNTIAGIVDAIFGDEIVITSTFEGNHSPGSLHYANLAVDIRRGKKPLNIRNEIKRGLGPDYDVIEYETHFHIEYDPK